MCGSSTRKPRGLVGLIGANIERSLSPALHEDAFASAGIVGHYHLMDVSALPGRSLADLLSAARTTGFDGVNVTHPYKEAVLPLLDEVASDAQRIGAVNTVVYNESGRTTGYNTDCSGFRRAFAEAFGENAVHDTPVLLLGAGGAGRAVAFALLELGAGTLSLFDRDPRRSAGLAAALKRHFGASSCDVVVDPAAALASAAGIVNATPVGMSGYPGVPLSLDLLQPHHFVADVIYTPIDTDFVKAAQRAGCRTMNGSGMCVYQAAEAFRHFTGITPDVGRMKRTFEAALARRDLVMAAGALS